MAGLATAPAAPAAAAATCTSRRPAESLRHRRRCREGPVGAAIELAVAKGGVNVMDWSDHVDRVQASWILKYLHPAESTWKTLLDAMLFRDEAATSYWEEVVSS